MAQLLRAVLHLHLYLKDTMPFTQAQAESQAQVHYAGKNS